MDLLYTVTSFQVLMVLNWVNSHTFVVEIAHYGRGSYMMSAIMSRPRDPSKIKHKRFDIPATANTTCYTSDFPDTVYTKCQKFKTFTCYSCSGLFLSSKLRKFAKLGCQPGGLSTPIMAVYTGSWLRAQSHVSCCTTGLNALRIDIDA